MLLPELVQFCSRFRRIGSSTSHLCDGPLVRRAGLWGSLVSVTRQQLVTVQHLRLRSIQHRRLDVRAGPAAKTASTECKPQRPQCLSCRGQMVVVSGGPCI